MNGDKSRTNGAENDKLTGSLARAMSWKGNICHKGFHARRACGRTAFLHIITAFYTPLMAQAHQACGLRQTNHSARPFPHLYYVISAAECHQLDAASQPVGLSAWVMSFEDHLLLPLAASLSATSLIASRLNWPVYSFIHGQLTGQRGSPCNSPISH